MEECCFLTYSLWLAHFAPQTHLPNSSTAHSRLGSSTAVINQENAPQTCIGQSDGVVFSVKIFFSQVTLTWVKLAKINKIKLKNNTTIQPLNYGRLFLFVCLFELVCQERQVSKQEKNPWAHGPSRIAGHCSVEECNRECFTVCPS